MKTGPVGTEGIDCIKTPKRMRSIVAWLWKNLLRYFRQTGMLGKLQNMLTDRVTMRLLTSKMNGCEADVRKKCIK